MAAGLIPDPYLDENEKTQTWIGLADWTYRTVLEWKPDGSDRQELVFEGIDTIASIRLGGAEIAATRNMHRSYRLDVTGRLKPGGNVLEVAICSPIKAADAASLALGYRPHTNHHPYNAIRKMACSFGWDWGIDTSTSALWKPVTLETWTAGRFSEVRVAGDVIDGEARLRVHVRVDRETDAPLMVSAQVAGVTTDSPVVDGVAVLDVAVRDAAWWWPRGYGDAALHDAEIALLVDGDVIDLRRHRVGFRSVEARITPDDAGIGFAIVVNGQTIHVRGANWIPDDAFLHRVDRARYARRLAQAEFANMNLLRVWGGGIYESEDFYAECDERGILAWQDFLLACAAYAEDEPLWSEIEAEAREAIVRLSAHPSLVVLNGNNENVIGFQDWGWKKRLEGRTWGAGYYYELFPALVAELAPHVAYTPGSPFSPDPEEPQNDPAQGTVHIWDLWNQKDWPHYRDYRPRFVSEFGWQGPPTWSTLVRAISDDPLTPESPGMIVHQKASKGNDHLTDGLTAHLPLPDTMDDWHWAMSLNQAVAIRTAVEWFRSLSPVCSGTIVWQLNDCWPVTSWAAVDGDERPKPLLYGLRDANTPRLLTIQPDGDDLRVAIINDTGDPWQGQLRLDRRDYGGNVLADHTLRVNVDAWGSHNVTIPSRVAAAADAARELVVAHLGDETAYWFFGEYRDTNLQPHAVSTQAEKREDGWDVTITASALAREVTLLVDRIDPDAVADKALVTILPHEHVVIHVTGALEANPRSFQDPSVVRSANDLMNI
ncbi:glycoside hydrolase family 2 protein [Microbacterium sp. HD4P20]|nr:glycoside hydrolase family 2 protein [Microbacterium sp. HD4P20]MCP2636034.1 glycoside hydrolase family 2 protein [Microbacterium sp. HD4P20]